MSEGAPLTGIRLRRLTGDFTVAKVDLKKRVPSFVASVASKIANSLTDIGGRGGEVVGQTLPTFISRTNEELSLIAPTTDLEGLPTDTDCIEVEGGWTTLAVVGPMEFSLVGIMAGLSTTLARESISILAESTFDTDFILVKTENAEKAIEALRSDGAVLVN